ncbi:MAG: hypothetical protein ACKOET_04780, partial [Verrucomicrobiota bacterium]
MVSSTAAPGPPSPAQIFSRARFIRAAPAAAPASRRPAPSGAGAVHLLPEHVDGVDDADDHRIHRGLL